VAQRAQALVTPRLPQRLSPSLNDPRSLEEMRAGMKRVNDQYSREKHQAAAALSWAKRRAPN
jgi:hypothetical protein